MISALPHPHFPVRYCMASCLLASDAPSRRLLWKKVHSYYGITPSPSPLPLFYEVGVNFLICKTDYARTLMWSFDLQTLMQRLITVIRIRFSIFLSLVYIYLRRFNIFIIHHTLYIWWVLCNNIQAKKLYNSPHIAVDARFSFRPGISSSHFIVLKFQHVLFWKRKWKWERVAAQ